MNVLQSAQTHSWFQGWKSLVVLPRGPSLLSLSYCSSENNLCKQEAGNLRPISNPRVVEDIVRDATHLTHKHLVRLNQTTVLHSVALSLLLNYWLFSISLRIFYQFASFLQLIPQWFHVLVFCFTRKTLVHNGQCQVVCKSVSQRNVLFLYSLSVNSQPRLA